MKESCESKVANLLASMDNLPLEDIMARLKVIQQIIELQGKEIAALQRQANVGKEWRETEPLMEPKS